MEIDQSVKEVLRIEANGSQSKVYLTKGKTEILNQDINELEKEYLQWNFIRIHPQHLINPLHYKQLSSIKALHIKMVDGSQLPIDPNFIDIETITSSSKSWWHKTLNLLNKYTFKFKIMKKNLLLSLLIVLSMGLSAQDYSIPPTTTGWGQVYNAPLVEDADGITFTCVGGRNGNRVSTNEVFDFSGKKINIKWKFDKTGGYNRCRIAILGTTKHFDIPAYSSLVSNGWYYSTLTVNADRSYSFKTAKNDYAENGGAQVTAVSGSFLSERWHNVTNGVLMFYWDDAAATTKLTIGETIVNTEHPKLMGAEPTIDMEDGLMPSGISTSGTWLVTDDGSGTNKCLYIDGIPGNKVEFNNAGMLAVKMDIKLEYKYAARIQLYLNGTLIHHLSDYELGSTQITPGWQTVVFPIPQTTGGKVGIQFDHVKTSDSRKVWIDNIEYLYANEAPTNITLSSGVDENVSTGTVVGDLSVTDKENDACRIALKAPSPMNDNDLFSINASNQLVINTVPDYELNQDYYIELDATDIVKGFDNGTYSKAISVVVNNLNDNTPILANATFNINENRPTGTVVTPLAGSDADGDLNPLSYTLISVSDIFEVIEDEIIVKNSTILNHEVVASEVLTVEVSDGTHASEASITVNIDDINECPVMAEVLPVNVNENASVGTLVATLSASDEDQGDDPSYAIDFGNNEGYFQVNSSTGDITIAKEGLDYETSQEFRLTVAAYDINEPIWDSKELVITINNLNDNAPTINSGEITIEEGTANGTVLYTVEVNDADGNLNPLIFTPELGHPAVDIVGADIVVVDAAQLDFETTQQITITGNVSDGTHTTPGSLVINLTNVNDNPPVLADFSVSVAERSSNGTVIATLEATDADGNLTLLEYGMMPEAGFDIVGNELIVTDGSLLDYETRSQLIIYAWVQDGEPMHTAYPYITVNITDIPDNAPSIQTETISITVCENSPASLSFVASGDGTLFYDWQFDGNSLGVPPVPHLTLSSNEIVETGYYTCVISSEFGQVTTQQVTISIRPLPVVNLGINQTITVNDQVTLDAGSGFVSYTWSDNSFDQTLLIDGSQYGIGNHTVSVSVEDDLGCVGTDEVIIDVTTATSIMNNSSDAIKIYPNPATDVLHIKGSTKAPVHIQLINLTGKLVKEWNNQNIFETPQLSLTNLPSGYYILRVFNNEFSYTERILKQ
jgi:hypothetical protein